MNHRWTAPVALLCSILLTAMTAFGANVDPKVVREALQRSAKSSSSANAAAQPNAAAAKTTPLVAFSMQGSGTLTGSPDGTCSGALCAASSNDCMCLQYQGTLNAKPFGAGTWTAQVTVNVDDCTNTGTPGPPPGGFCCVGDGTITATDKTRSANSLMLSITGSVCADPNADQDVGVSATYIILPAASGKYAHSTGTGQVNLFSIDIDQPAYLSGDGLIQVVSPF